MINGWKVENTICPARHDSALCFAYNGDLVEVARRKEAFVDAVAVVVCENRILEGNRAKGITTRRAECGHLGDG